MRTYITSQKEKKGQSRIKICDDNGDPFIKTLHNVLLAPDLSYRVFSIIALMNSGHNCIFHKGFCTVYFGAKENNAVNLPHSSQRKHAFLGKIMVRLENGDRTLLKEGWQNKRIVYGTRVMYD